MPSVLFRSSVRLGIDKVSTYSGEGERVVVHFLMLV